VIFSGEDALEMQCQNKKKKAESLERLFSSLKTLASSERK
jgi:hypothetical protein